MDTTSSRRRPRPDERRTQARERLWPSSGDKIWNRKTNDGFTTVPRLLPLVLKLIRKAAPTGDPSSVYVDLWSRVYDEGFIKVSDPHSFAFSAGYEGKRALRTWRERIEALKDLGFIKTAPLAGFDIGYILLVNPLEVAAKLREAEHPSANDAWWSAMLERADEVGAELPVPATDVPAYIRESAEA